MKVVFDESGFFDDNLFDEIDHFHPNFDESVPNRCVVCCVVLCCVCGVGTCFTVSEWGFMCGCWFQGLVWTAPSPGPPLPQDRPSPGPPFPRTALSQDRPSPDLLLPGPQT